MPWYGIKGETVGEGKVAMSVVRVQTSKDGHWQALNNDEINRLLIEHNKNVTKKKDNKTVGVAALPNIDQTTLKKAKAAAMYKLYGKKKAKVKK